MNASTILGKIAIDLNTGKSLGVVKNLNFNDNASRLISFLSADDNTQNLVLSKDILSLGCDAIIVTDFNESDELYSFCPINSMAYNLEGELLGKITDVELDEKLNALSFEIGGKDYSPSIVTSAKDTTMLLNTSGKKVKKRPFKKLIEEAKRLPTKVQILPIEENFPSISEPGVRVGKTYLVNPNSTPNHVVSKESHLLGRKTTKTILGLNNEVIARENLIITQKTVELATKHSKLCELTLYSK